jgi:hypothetical protein
LGLIYRKNKNIREKEQDEGKEEEEKIPTLPPVRFPFFKP